MTAPQHSASLRRIGASVAGRLAALIFIGLLSSCGSRVTSTAGAHALGTATPASVSSIPTATSDEIPTAAVESGVTQPPLPVLAGQVVSASLGDSIAPNSQSTRNDLPCPDGYVLAGGGIASSSTSFNMEFNDPIATQYLSLEMSAWAAQVTNHDSNAVSAQVRVICLKAAGLRQSNRFVQSYVPSDSTSAPLDVTCPAGFFVGGGGVWSGDYPGTVTADSAPSGTSTWHALVTLHGPDSFYNLIALCLSAEGLTSQIVTRDMGTIVAKSASAIIDVTCPTGYLVAGGGVSSASSNFTTMTSVPQTTTTWRAQLYNNSSSAMTANARVACLKLG